MRFVPAPATAFWRLAFVAAVIAVLVLSLLPASELPKFTRGWDKIQHVLAYVGLGLLGLAAWPERAMLVFAALLAFGAGIEVLQGLSGWRSAEWGDLLADAIGLGVVAMAYAQWRRLAPAGT